MLKGLFTNNKLNVDGALAISAYENGKPYTVFGDLAVVVDGTPSYDDQGFFFDANGRLCVASVAAITAYANGVPFAADGSLCVTLNGAPAAYANGLSFDSSNRLVTTSAAVRPVAEVDGAVARDVLAVAVA